jgi:hypothetical protein
VKSQKKSAGGLSVNAPVFNPIFGVESSGSHSKGEGALQLPIEVAVEPYADFGGYKNRHLNVELIAETKIKT